MNGFNSRRLVLLVIVAAGAGSCRDNAPRGTYPRAPIIVISLDTVRKDAISGFGAEAGRTPALEAFGAEGFRFQNAIAASHHTAPSHATMLTGFTPFVHGVALAEGTQVYQLPERIPTLAELLKDAGYQTGGFTDGIQLLPERGFDRGFDTYEYETTNLDAKLPKIERFLDACGDEPFFLFAHTYRAHQPYRAEPDRLEELLADYDGTFAAAARETAEFPAEKIRAQDEAALQRQADLTMALSPRLRKSRKDLRFIRDLYGAAVEGADAECGRLLELLRSRGLLDRAIVVITSDHGEAFVEHKHCVVHMDLWDEVLRVPLAVRLPDRRGAGTDVEGQVGSERLVPTLLDLVGVESPVATEGASYAGTLVDGEVLREEPVFSAMYVTGIADPVMQTTRTRFFKRFDALVARDVLPPRARPLHPAAFFDLVNDPGESLDLAGTGHPELERFERVVRDRTEQWARLRRHFEIQGGMLAELSPEDIEAMKGVGYLGDK